MLSQHWLSRQFGVLAFCVLTFRHHGAAKDRDPKETPQGRSRSTRMMATRRSRLKATRRLAKTWILRRLPKTRSQSTRVMATRRSRPMGAWCKGFGFHFAVADADMKKDTNNNIELLARLMEQLYCAWGALPLSIAIIQDNTA